MEIATVGNLSKRVREMLPHSSQKHAPVDLSRDVRRGNVWYESTLPTVMSRHELRGMNSP